MNFTWDEDKRRANLSKHGLDFEAADKLFDDYRLERLDTRRDYGEDRWIALGLIHGNVAVLVYTERGEDIRVISLRKATPEERQIYEQARFKRLGPA